MGSNDLKSSLEKQRLGPPLNVQMLKIWRLSATPWNPIAIRLNLVILLTSVKFIFKWVLLFWFKKIHLNVKKISKVNVTFQNLTRGFDLMVTNFSTCNLSFVHFVHIFQNVHLIPKEKFRKVSIGQILTKTLNLLANLVSTIFNIYPKLV